MREIKTCFASRSADAAASNPGPVKVVGVHRDLAAYIAAAHQLESIVNRYPCACRLDSHWWSFEALQRPEIRETAARVAAEADIVWCSACVCEPLPDAVKAWMESWVERKHKLDAALVALLRCPLAHNFEQSPTRLCLFAAAHKSGMQYFEHRLDCDCSQSHSSIMKNAFPPLSSSPPDWRATRNWGINE